MVMNLIFPRAHLSPGAYALVAMAAVFGAAARATFALIVFAFEITRDYNAILPLMLGCVIADLIALRFLPDSIMTERLARRGVHVPGEYDADVFRMVRVADVMRTNVPRVQQDITVAELAEATRGSQPQLNLADGLTIVDQDGGLMGVVTQGDVLRALENDPAGRTTVLEAGSDAPVWAHPDESVAAVLRRMLQHDIGRLPVVDRQHPRKIVGYLTRANVLGTWTRRLEEEGVRERGWLHRWSSVASPRTAPK